MKKNKIVFSALSVLLSLLLANIAGAQINGYSQITDQWCDAINRCPSGLECYSFPGIGLRCAQPDPCDYFKCPQGTRCVIAESYPGQVKCHFLPLLNIPNIPIEYSGELTVEDSKLFMKTSAGEKAINLMPEEAIAASETPDAESITKIELKEEAEKPIYSVKGVKQVRLFFIIPLSIEIETKINAESGGVVSIKKPWWSFLAW